MSTYAWVFVVLLSVGAVGGRAQAFDAEQLVLDVEKLGQLKQILQDLKDGYQVLQSGYSAIRDIAQGSFHLHKTFLDGLLAVSPAVRGYERVAAIVNMQGQLVQRCQAAWGQFRQDGRLLPGELTLLGQVYGAVLAGCAEDLDHLVTVLTDGLIRASDAERLQEIDTIYYRVRAKLALVNQVSNETALLSLQRGGETGDTQTLRWLFGVTP
jgi:hypothetical protein